MTESSSARIVRRVARIWSIVVFGFTLLRILTPDPYATEPVPIADWFLLSLWGVAILGLLLAWRWELPGAVITIATMFIRELAWVLLKGRWFASFLIIWACIVPPAILYLVAWGIERAAAKSKPVSGIGRKNGDIARSKGGERSGH